MRGSEGKAKSTNDMTNGDYVTVWRCVSGLRPVGSRVGNGVVEPLKTSNPTGIGLARRPTPSSQIQMAASLGQSIIR